MALKKGENAPDHAAGGWSRANSEERDGVQKRRARRKTASVFHRALPVEPRRPRRRSGKSRFRTLTRAEWEQLCDGCGRCCLVKLEDEDTGAIHHTSVACKLLDQQSCRCGDYPRRRRYVPDCVRLTLEKLVGIPWLPPTCAYVLRHQGKPLPPWHPLISGDPESVSRAGVSARGRIEAGEDDVETDDLPDFIRLWPKRWPKKARW